MNLEIHNVLDHIRVGNDLTNIAECFSRLNSRVWSGLTDQSYIWNVSAVKSHFANCPEGSYFLVNKRTREIVGSLTTMKINYESGRNWSWKELTNERTMSNHDPNGDTRFGVDLSILKDGGARLIAASLLIGLIGEGLKFVILGARIPSYHKYSDMDVCDYVYRKRKSGKPLDPELYFYQKNGFEIVKIIPNYMNDPKSLNYGVLVRRKNPVYALTNAIPLAKPIIRYFGRLIFLTKPKKGEKFK